MHAVAELRSMRQVSVKKTDPRLASRVWILGGGGGIRTPGTLSGSPVFKTGALNHSTTPPGVLVEGEGYSAALGRQVAVRFRERASLTFS